jgi:membrane associated rhomboid family serine protease
MLPIRDDNPHYLSPITTRGLILANALMWIFVQGIGRQMPLASSVCDLGLIPARLLQLVEAGTQVPLGPDLMCVIEPGAGLYTILTSMFLHGGWFHILGNMWFLWIFGNNVEDSMGHGRFLVFYLLGGLAAALLQIVSEPSSAVPMVGASGAIGAVMGAYLVLYPRVRVHVLLMLGFFVTSVAIPAVFMLGYWFLLQLASASGMFGGGPGGEGGVAFWAHVGGFLFGVLAVRWFRVPEMVARHPSHGWTGGSGGRAGRGRDGWGPFGRG